MKILISLIALLISLIINAEEKNYKSLCVEQKSTGFTYENNYWRQSNFELDKFYIKKIDIEKSGTCSSKYKSFKDSDWSKVFKKASINFGCYITMPVYDTSKAVSEDSKKLAEMFMEVTALMGASLCKEFWKDEKLERVHCLDKSLSFKPSGTFRKATMNYGIDAVNIEEIDTQYKGEQSTLSIGNCTKI